MLRGSNGMSDTVDLFSCCGLMINDLSINI